MTSLPLAALAPVLFASLLAAVLAAAIRSTRPTTRRRKPHRPDVAPARPVSGPAPLRPAA
jgi:hypothetical protein